MVRISTLPPKGVKKPKKLPPRPPPKRNTIEKEIRREVVYYTNIDIDTNENEKTRKRGKS